jgi:hypothetical protein
MGTLYDPSWIIAEEKRIAAETLRSIEEKLDKLTRSRKRARKKSKTK